MNEENMLNYMGHQWILIDGDTVTVGLSEEGLEDYESITSVDLPVDNEEVAMDEACGTVETDDGPLDIYSPADGQVLEVNPAIQEDPSIIKEDPTGEGWLFKIEASNPEDLKVAMDNDEE